LLVFKLYILVTKFIFILGIKFTGANLSFSMTILFKLISHIFQLINQ